MNTSAIRRLAILSTFIPLLCACGDDDNKSSKPPEPNFITVLVQTTGVVMGQDDHGENHTIPNVTVRVDMVKAGGQTFYYELPTNEAGAFSCPEVMFKLYREQPITSTGAVVGGHEQLPYIFNQKTLTLTWEEVDAVRNMGETYSWQPHLIIFGSTK